VNAVPALVAVTGPPICCLFDEGSTTDAMLACGGDEHEFAVALGILMTFDLAHVQ
jgi:hypothetical protein